LQGPDQVELDAGSFRLQLRPLGPRLLHPVLAEDALSRRDRRPDGLRIEGLRHRDERDNLRPAAGFHCRRPHPRPHLGEVFRDLFHGPPLSTAATAASTAPDLSG
jgi:hypothetical protein